LVITEISLIDLILSIFYILLILLVSQALRPNPSKSYAKLYLPFILSKISAAILFVLIHVYYYKGGDTFLYFSGANFFSDQITSNFTNILDIYFSSKNDISNIVFKANYVYALNSSDDVFFLSKFLGLVSFLANNEYLASSIIFTLLTAIGIWKLYITLCEIFPSLYKYFAIGILFYPSLCIWGSGILKDPLTLACVGFIFNSFYNLINRRNVTSSIIITVVCLFLRYILQP
jgi:hypothetical protein